MPGPLLPKASFRKTQTMALPVPFAETLGEEPGKPKLAVVACEIGVALNEPLAMRNALR